MIEWIDTGESMGVYREKHCVARVLVDFEEKMGKIERVGSVKNAVISMVLR